MKGRIGLAWERGGLEAKAVLCREGDHVGGEGGFAPNRFCVLIENGEECQVFGIQESCLQMMGWGFMRGWGGVLSGDLAIMIILISHETQS